MSDALLTIGELAERTGVATSALRYYEEIGLMPRARRVSGQRRYGDAAVRDVAMILLLRDTGFSLNEIATLVGTRTRDPGAWRNLAQKKLVELDELVARTGTARDALEHALRCRHRHLSECPNFQGVVAAKLAGRPLGDAHTH